MVGTNVLAAATAVMLATSASAYTIPANLQRLYNAHKAGKCANKLQGGFVPGVDSSDATFAYCADILDAIYLHSSSSGGTYADMDVDCDGANRSAGGCANDPTGQDTTAFQYTVHQKYGIQDLDANLHSYVVFGNEGFDPQGYGMKPLSVMAVVCNGQLHYGVWGDTNGANTVGEASLSLAQTCFPKEGLTGDNGHGGRDVMYIGFTKGDTVPDDANWKASSRAAFEDSLKARGDKLVAALGG